MKPKHKFKSSSPSKDKAQHIRIDQGREDVCFCHYSDAVYMGGMQMGKRNGFGMLVHDDGSMVLGEYVEDVEVGHHLILRQNSMCSILYKSVDQYQIVYKISRYILKMQFSATSMNAQGRGLLIDYQHLKIYQLVFQEGLIISKVPISDQVHHQNVFTHHSISSLLALQHQHAFNLQLHKHQSISIKLHNHTLSIGFVNQQGNWNGLGCRLFVSNMQVSGFNGLFIKTMEKGFYRDDKLFMFGMKCFKNGNKYMGGFVDDKEDGCGLLLAPDMRWRCGKFMKGELAEIQSANQNNYRQVNFQLWSEKMKEIHRSFDKVYIDCHIELPSELILYRTYKASINHHLHTIASSIYPDHYNQLSNSSQEKIPYSTPMNKLTALKKSNHFGMPELPFLMEDPFEHAYDEEISDQHINKQDNQRPIEPVIKQNQREYKGSIYGYQKQHTTSTYIPQQHTIIQKYSNQYASNSPARHQPLPQKTYPNSYYSYQSKPNHPSPNQISTFYPSSSSPHKMERSSMKKQHLTKRMTQKQLLAYEQGLKGREREWRYKFIENNYRLW